MVFHKFTYWRERMRENVLELIYTMVLYGYKAECKFVYAWLCLVCGCRLCAGIVWTAHDRWTCGSYAQFLPSPPTLSLQAPVTNARTHNRTSHSYVLIIICNKFITFPSHAVIMFYSFTMANIDAVSFFFYCWKLATDGLTARRTRIT